MGSDEPLTDAEHRDAMRAALESQRLGDPLLDGMLADGEEVTRATYLKAAGVTEPVPAELENELPYPLRKGYVLRVQRLPAGTPPIPERGAFGTQEEFEEAKGRWMETVGRALALRRGR